MDIEYTKQAVKQISKLDKPTLKFIPADAPELDEIKAINETRDETEFISHNDIDWD